METSYHQKIIAFFITCFLFSISQSFGTNGYGYFLSTDEHCYVWWAEGAYQVMRDDPIPSGKVKPVQIWSAKNEYESFQLILNPKLKINNLIISSDGFSDDRNNKIPSGNISIKKAEYLEVTKPTDYYGTTGWYPDPLPTLEEPATLFVGVNQPFWITIKVPSDTPAGKYKGVLNINADGWDQEIQIALEVWDFTLPDNPSVRSAFGIGTESIQKYHNLETDKELKEVTDKYYQSMKEYKIAPTSPFSLYPMQVTVDGLNWDGGEFTLDSVHAGKMSLKVVDDSFDETAEATSRDLLSVSQSDSYFLSWYARTGTVGQQYSVLVKCYDNNKIYMPYENRMNTFTGKKVWNPDTLDLRQFREKIKYVSIHLFPVFRDLIGSQMGTAWFDDITLYSDANRENILTQGDFEVVIENLDVNVDFTEFDIAGKKYLDEYGFNAFNLNLQGLPSGTFYAQKLGSFAGFAQGTVEYNYLMKDYMIQVQDHLEEKGWLGKEYTYWFDEPNTENYPFVREGMEIIHRSAPKITRFITEHQPGADIMDVTEISCTVIGRLDPEMMEELSEQGREFWSYVCCCPKAPWLSLFIDHDAINMRMWLWMSYQYHLKGILIWSANYWNSTSASPKDYLQNPWDDPMSYMTGYGTPLGTQTLWGNGDGRFFYPPNRTPNDHSSKYLEAPIPSLRLEIMRDGIEDYEYLLLLEKAIEKSDGKKQKNLVKKAKGLLQFPDEMFTSAKEYNKDPQYLIDYRKRIGILLNELVNK